MKFLSGKDYPHLCSACRATIDQAAMILAEEGPDTDDPEAPATWVYDHRLYCGGRECQSHQREKEQHSLTPRWYRVSSALWTGYLCLDQEEARQWRTEGASVVAALPPWVQGLTGADRQFAEPD